MNSQPSDRGEDEPVVVRERFSAADPDAAQAFLSAAYADQRLWLNRPLADFHYEHRTTATDQFAINRISNSCTLLFDITPMDELLVVSTVHDGRLAFDRSAYEDTAGGAGDTLLAPPGSRFHSVMEQVDLDTVVLSLDGAARYAAATCGLAPDRLRVTGTTPVSAATAEHWTLTTAHIRDSLLDNPAAAGSPLALDSMARLLHAAFLTTFPTTALEAALDPAQHPGATRPHGHVAAVRLRDAVDFLHAHADRPVGPEDWGAVAGDVPGRELDEALLRHRATTAARELWRARLRGAHDDLLAAGPGSSSGSEPGSEPGAAAVGTDTVVRIAARWGFVHLPSFRIAYTAYTRGETPEQTLRR